MTDPELASALRDASRTYPRWMDRADTVATWDFRRIVTKAAALATAKRDRHWRSEASTTLSELRGLQSRVEGRAA